MADVTTQDIGRAYWAGVEHERRRIAEAWTELDEAWRPIGPQLHADRVAARIALFEECARAIAAARGRPYREYRGGPVDWETGEPVAA